MVVRVSEREEAKSATHRARRDTTLLGTLKLKASLPSPALCGVGLSVPQVNGQNVVKVGHRQVVNMIRQGGNTLMVKVVMVTRHPDMDEAVHKKGACPLFVCGQTWAPHCHQTEILRGPNGLMVLTTGLLFPKAACS